MKNLTKNVELVIEYLSKDENVDGDMVVMNFGFAHPKTILFSLACEKSLMESQAGMDFLKKEFDMMCEKYQNYLNEYENLLKEKDNEIH